MSSWAAQLRAYKPEQNPPSSTAVNHNGHHPAYGNDLKSKMNSIRLSGLHNEKRERKFPANKNLERCVQLLTQMLDSEQGSTGSDTMPTWQSVSIPSKSSKALKPRAVASKKKTLKPKAKGHVIRKGKGSKQPVKSDARKPNSAAITKHKVDSLTSSAPTQSDVDDIPERDSNQDHQLFANDPSKSKSGGIPEAFAVRFDTSCHPLPAFQAAPSSSHVPFNKRLSTSTPTQLTSEAERGHSTVSPWRYVPSQSGSICSDEYHLTRVGTNPLNSTDQCKEAAPPKPVEPQPKLRQAAFEFAANPLAKTTNAWRHNPCSPVRLNDPGNYSLYSSGALKEMDTTQDRLENMQDRVASVPGGSSTQHLKLSQSQGTISAGLHSLNSKHEASCSSDAKVSPENSPPRVTKVHFDSTCSHASAKEASVITLDTRNKSTSAPDLHQPHHVETQTSQLVLCQECPADAAKQAGSRESPQRQQKLRALHDLLRELKTEAGDNMHMMKLVGEIEATSSVMVWGSRKVNQQLELDLAIQPLRSENAQLRRQLRIANLHLKNQQMSDNDKPEPDFNVVHLEVVRQQLESSLKEERKTCESLKQEVKHLQMELDNIMRDKQQLLEIVMKKDNDFVHEMEKLLSDRRELSSKLEELKSTKHNLETEVKEQSKKLQMQEVTIEQKTKEIQQLQELVSGLQMSMKRLLHDLQTRPDPNIAEVSSNLFATDNSVISAEAAKGIMEEQYNGFEVNVKEKETHVPHTGDRDIDSKMPHESYASARKSLTFERDNKERKLPSGKEHENDKSVQITQLLDSVQTGNVVVSHSDTFGMDMTVSDYDLPPGASPFGSKFKLNEGGLTVKELLTPLADRMLHQFQRLSTQGNLQQTSPKQPTSVVHPDDIAGYSSIESDHGEGESTLVEEGNNQEETAIDQHEDTRYSLTDYFKMYSSKPLSALEKVRESESSAASSLKTSSADGSTPRDSMQPSTVKSGSGSLRSRPSLQDSLYKGTDLDTSLSTIPGAEDCQSVVSSVTATTASSIDSVSSIDDHAFKQGLAALDANIQRMQQQLKITNLSR